LSIPNLITLGRILLVPFVVWAIASGAMWIAFVLFLAAGASDAVDGFLAKRFHMTSELGSYLDPLADKALLVSIYLSLGILGETYPGYFEVGDAAGLATLLGRCEDDPGFLGELWGRVAALRPLVDPAHERASWRDLLRELAVSM